VFAEDKLFSTLDTRTRQWATLKDWGRVLLSDTGRVHPRTCPTHLVASFKATLEETRQAPTPASRRGCRQPGTRRNTFQAVNAVCCRNSTAATSRVLLVLNKIDRLKDPGAVLTILQSASPPRRSVVSAGQTDGDSTRLRERG